MDNKSIRPKVVQIQMRSMVHDPKHEGGCEQILELMLGRRHQGRRGLIISHTSIWRYAMHLLRRAGRIRLTSRRYMTGGGGLPFNTVTKETGGARAGLETNDW